MTSSKINRAPWRSHSARSVVWNSGPGAMNPEFPTYGSTITAASVSPCRRNNASTAGVSLNGSVTVNPASTAATPGLSGRTRAGTPAPGNSPRPAGLLWLARRAPPSDSRQGDRPEIVVLARRESRRHEGADLCPSTPLEVGGAVHVVGLPRHPTDMGRAGLVGLGDAVHQHRYLPPHEAREALCGDRALYLEQLLQPVTLYAVGHVVWVLGRSGPLLGGVREGAEPVELGFFDEGQELAKVFVGRAREPHEPRTADRHVGARTPQPRQLLPQGAFPLGPAHPLEHAVRGVLDRDVEVWHDARAPSHKLHEAVGEAR